MWFRAAFLMAFSSAAVAVAQSGTAATPELVKLAPGQIHSNLAARPDPTQTYDLYLPRGFTPERRWPLLMVFDPRSRGRFAAEIFVPAAERHGWVVASSNNTRSDGPFDPNVRAVNAMFPDLMARLPIDGRRIYATGFSGGAILAWLVGVTTHQLAGVISVGGRPPDGLEQGSPSFALWGAAGTSDFNYQPTRELDELAARAGRPHRFEPFPGPHAWFDAAEARRAVAWLDVLAMRDGLRPRDEAAIDEALGADRAAAEALAANGDPLGAARAFAAIAETYRGLRPVDAEARRAAEVESSPAARTARKEEAWVVRYEEQGRRRISETLAYFRSEEVLPVPGKLRASLQLDALLARSKEGGPRGLAADRVLASVAAQFGFYLVRELFGRGDYGTAAASLALAVEARPHDPFLWYNLACAQARVGRKRDALASLVRAFDEKIPNPGQIAEDADLAPLRDAPEFAALLARAAAPPG
jgi:dienelactone hydrolase